MAADLPITSKGYARLKIELKRKQTIERRKVADEIEIARSHGDLRENAEYHAAKERQAELAARMAYLEGRIGLAHVIDPVSINSETVGFGATITLTDMDTDEEVVYALVGEDETNVKAGRISITAPIARAMLGKGEGDDVTVRLPKGDREFEIIKIEYKALN